MKELVKNWLPVVLLLGLGAVFAVSAAFLCAGIIIFALVHPEVAVLFVFALWLLWFGWRTREELSDDAQDDAEDDNIILFNRYC